MRYHLQVYFSLSKLIKASPIMIFIKGTPDAPRCGFSKTLIGLMNEENVKYGTFDILEDDEVGDSVFLCQRTR